MIIAIDGPAGSGKSTVARRIARQLGFRYLDTGALYRAVTLAISRAGLAAALPQQIVTLAQSLDITIGTRTTAAAQVVVNGEDVSEAIRSPNVTRLVKQVAQIPGIRTIVTRIQHEIARCGHVVVEGRDTTTVVFPHAEHKVFLTASNAERARRRLHDVTAQGVHTTIEEVLREIEERDRVDSTRQIAPLTVGKNVVVVDTTGLRIEESVAKILIATNLRQSRYNWWYALARFVMLLLFKLLFRFRVHGAAHIPQRGGFIVASNHQSYLDPIVLGIGSRRQISYLARDTLFRSPLFGWLIRSVNTHPIRRGQADREALHMAIRLLRGGHGIVLFPEGTRSKDGELGKPKHGVGYAALRSGCPVVPAYIRGSWKALPRDAKMITMTPLTVRFGKPLDLSDLLTTAGDTSVYTQAAARIMHAIRELKEES